MTLDLIFLPLLGGYIFFALFNGTRYRASNFPAQRIVFPSAAYGLIFIVIARTLEMGAQYCAIHLTESLDHSIGLAIPAAALVVMLAIGIGILSANKRIGARIRLLRQKHTIQSALAAIASESVGQEALRLVAQTFALATICAWITKSAFVASSFPFGVWIYAVLKYTATILAVCFIASWILRRYTLQDIQSTLFRLSVVVLIVVCLIAVGVLHAHNISSSWAKFSPIENSGTPFLSVLLAIAAFWLLNRVVPPLTAGAFHFVTERMDQLQQLFYESAIEKMLVQINLEDNKVYIGWIRSLPPATESAAGYFLILPLKSGYRDEKSRELVLTTDYSGVLIELNQTSSDAADLNDKLELYYKVIRTSCISLASRFNSEEFDKFSHNRQIVLS